MLGKQLFKGNSVVLNPKVLFARLDFEIFIIKLATKKNTKMAAFFLSPFCHLEFYTSVKVKVGVYTNVCDTVQSK